jgi:hypothetical protein
MLPEPYEVMAHVAAHGPGVPWSHYTSEWAAANGLPVTCDRCGLPFDRTGVVEHIPAKLQDALHAEGRVAENTHCPRFIGRNEHWDCTGISIHAPVAATAAHHTAGRYGQVEIPSV